MKGLGNQIAYENRIYDPRIGRWLSLDPLQEKYPNESNYAYVSNSPVLYSDKDGKDKIITITRISTNGQKSVIIITDKNHFKFSAKYRDLSVEVGYPSREFIKGYKESVFENFVIDLANPSNNSYSLSTKIEETYNFQVTYLASKLFGPGDQSSKMKIGYILMGSGKSIGDAKRNESAAEGSEILDIGKLVSALENWREFGIGSKQEPFDFLKNDTYLKSILEYTDNLLDAANTIDEALDLSPSGSNANSTAKIEPGNNHKKVVIPLTRTIFNRHGNKENKDWKNGQSRTVGEETDSLNKTGDTTYRLRTEYKRN